MSGVANDVLYLWAFKVSSSSLFRYAFYNHEQLSFNSTFKSFHMHECNYQQSILSAEEATRKSTAWSYMVTKDSIKFRDCRMTGEGRDVCTDLNDLIIDIFKFRVREMTVHQCRVV